MAGGVGGPAFGIDEAIRGGGSEVRRAVLEIILDPDPLCNPLDPIGFRLRFSASDLTPERPDCALPGDRFLVIIQQFESFVNASELRRQMESGTKEDQAADEQRVNPKGIPT